MVIVVPLILEGIVTTENEDGSVNVSPMGPVVDLSMRTLLLRPYNTSNTYKNLKRIARGVFLVTDDVEMLAGAAVGELNPVPAFDKHEATGGWILRDACRWYAFEVQTLDDESERTTIQCDVTDGGRLRDFFGFNRAKHAVLEAAILATRTKFLPADDILSDMQRLALIVEKTAGDQELRAFQFLQKYVARELGGE